MGNRKLKRLDALGTASQNKPLLNPDPKNRSERRKLERELRKAGVSMTERDLVISAGISAILATDREVQS